MQFDRHRELAGGLLVAVGALLLLGVVTAEAGYPGYSTTTQTISALGAAAAPAASSLAFNTTMVLSGLLVAVAAWSIHHVFGDRALTGMVLLIAIPGLVGVGVFPSQTGVPHALAAMFSFAGAGVTALVAARVFRGPYRYVSAALGVLVLVSFVLFVVLRGANPLGDGGLERVVFYLSVTWVVATGGYVLAGVDHG